MSLCTPSAIDPFPTFDAAGAWLSLPQVTKDLIGTLALQMTFGAFVSQDHADEPTLFDPVQRQGGLEREGSAIAAIQVTFERALPAIFGREGQPAEWVLADDRPLAHDPRSDAEIADAAINGLRRIFVPASMLAEA